MAGNLYCLAAGEVLFIWRSKGFEWVMLFPRLKKKSRTDFIWTYNKNQLTHYRQHTEHCQKLTRNTKLSLPALLTSAIFLLISTAPEAATVLYPNSMFNFKKEKKKTKQTHNPKNKQTNKKTTQEKDIFFYDCEWHLWEKIMEKLASWMQE